MYPRRPGAKEQIGAQAIDADDQHALDLRDNFRPAALEAESLPIQTYPTENSNAAIAANRPHAISARFDAKGSCVMPESSQREFLRHAMILSE